jgi:hypothetical protein
MPCTVCWITDRKAATVVAVSPTGIKVTVREDKSMRTDKNGMSDSQIYSYERDPKGTEHVFHRQGDGTYRSANQGKRLALGVRHTYYDYGF